MLMEESQTEAYYGRLRKAVELTRQAVESEARAGAPERGSDWYAAAALRAAKVGETTRARELAREAVSLNPRPGQTAAQAFAAAGDATRAMEIAQQLSQEFPRAMLLQGCGLPAIRAEVYVWQGEPDSATEEIERALPRDPRFSDPCGFGTAYLLGEAHLKAGRPEQAAAQFRKVLDHPGIVGSSIGGPLARLQLARAQVMMGDKSAARESYEDFLILWKNADLDIPIYKEAKAEYAKLQ